jgi:hypothetical protein
MLIGKGVMTMSNTRILPAVTIALLLSSVAAGAAAAADSVTAPAVASGDHLPESLSALLGTIRANRKELLAINLGLTPEQAEKFWPLYGQYQQKLNPIGDRQAAIVQDYITNYRDLSNDKAIKIVEDYLEVDADRTEVRQKYVDKFAKILPGRTLARFYQIENKMDAVIRYDLAATIPVVDPAVVAAP